MKKLALGVILAGFLAGCGGGSGDDGDDDVTPVVDAPMTTQIDAAVPVTDACNPLSPAGMQGCAAGQKCTWISLINGETSADDIGKIGCVPDGSVALGAACTAGEPGEATGYDNCAAGSYCISATCQDICGFNGDAASTCATGFACTRYASLFANGEDDPEFGACNPTCDPVTQKKGGTDETCGTGKGCYLLSSETGTVAVCAGGGNAANVHNVQIRAAGLTTPIYVNSCAPGFAPRSATQGTGAAIECGGFCKAAPVYGDTPASGTTAAMPGMNDGVSGRVNYEGGDTRTMNWMGMPATCANAAGGESSLGGQAVLPSNTATGESCQFYYMSEFYAGISDYSNSVGMCFQFRQWRFDGTPPTDGSTSTPDTAWPSCRTLNRGTPSALVATSGTPPTFPQASADAIPDGAAYFGCVESVPSMLQKAARNAIKWDHRSELKLDRLAPLN